MKRALRKNTFGQPTDTICGRVKGKRKSGERTGEMPFLYLVKAYIVADGNSESVAAVAYRTICNSPDARAARKRPATKVSEPLRQNAIAISHSYRSGSGASARGKNTLISVN
ncbi:MAG: hypothetical protein WCC80_20530 [Pseudolabrys sp.]